MIFFSKMQPTMSSNPLCALHISLRELGLRGQAQENADFLASAIAMNNKHFFVSVPGVSYFLPISVKLWQANLLSYKYGRISGLRPSTVFVRQDHR